jgi:hypothetical protein
MICRKCGNEFEPRGQRKVFCSKVCYESWGFERLNKFGFIVETSSEVYFRRIREEARMIAWEAYVRGREDYVDMERVE